MPLKIRTQKPPQYTNYKLYKEYLRVEFDYCCVYCKVREPEIGGSHSFHIDHYAPKYLFPEKATDYANLFYSCRECNTHKGKFWPDKSRRDRGQFILNPCDHNLNEHYDQQGDKWIAKSLTATWNITKLRLNSPKNLTLRKDRKIIFNTIKEKEAQVNRIKQLLTEIEGDTDSKAKLEMRLSKIQDEIDAFMRKVSVPLD
jgi:hypothetical protein